MRAYYHCISGCPSFASPVGGTKQENDGFLPPGSNGGDIPGKSVGSIIFSHAGESTAQHRNHLIYFPIQQSDTQHPCNMCLVTLRHMAKFSSLSLAVRKSISPV